MTAQAVKNLVAQLSHPGLNLSLASASGLAVAPSIHLTADLRDLIRSSKALLIEQSLQRMGMVRSGAKSRCVPGY